MHQLLLSVSSSDSLALYGGGAVILAGASALLFIVALFSKRPRTPKKKLPEQSRLIGPASAEPGAARLQPPEESVVQIDEDDPRMAAAVIEAKQRLPEFVNAFSKAKDGYNSPSKLPLPILARRMRASSCGCMSVAWISTPCMERC